MDKIIEFSGITRVFHAGDNETKALDGVNLQVEKGSFLGVMGRSGSGKSTMLNIMGLLDRPTSGTYLLKGNDVSTYSDKVQAELRNKMFGFVVQDFALVENYTAAQNIAIPFAYMKESHSGKEKQVLIKKALSQVGLSDKADVRACLLSGGQRQRVAIARAILLNPEIILADEPTGALDSGTTEEVMELFVELNRQGKTIVLITHDDKVASYCDRVVEISDGKIQTQRVDIQES